MTDQDQAAGLRALTNYREPIDETKLKARLWDELKAELEREVEAGMSSGRPLFPNELERHYARGRYLARMEQSETFARLREDMKRGGA